MNGKPARQILALAIGLVGVPVAVGALGASLPAAWASTQPGKVTVSPASVTAGTTRPRQWSGQLRVAKIFVETPEVRTFRLVLPAGSRLPFEHQPGQYLTLTLEIDGRKVRRSYTIASSPTRSGYCELSIKREENGLASRHLHDTVREGDLLQVSAPAGRFIFTGLEAEQIVLIAGGVGITPLMAKIRYLTDLAWQRPIHLIFSVKGEQDIIFRSDLAELQQRFATLKGTITLKREADAAWPGGRGRTPPTMLSRPVPGLAAGRVHFCGPTEMTDPVIAMARALGVAEDMIQVESFASPSRAQARDAAPAPSTAVGVGPAADATLQFAR